MTPGEQILVGLIVLVGGGLLLALLKVASAYVTSAIAAQVVDKIGDNLQERWRADMDEKLAPINEELQYNGGQSVKDIVHRIERTLEQVLNGG